MKNKSLWRTITWLSVFGILLAVYLFYNFLFKPAFQPCSINAIVNCDAVTHGPLATLLGIPVSLVGLIGYIIILISSLKRWEKMVLGMSTFGMVFCLYITYQEIFNLRVICPVCLACQIVMLTIFVLSIVLVRNKKV